MVDPVVYREVLTNGFTAWSVDPAFPHCYGTGRTSAVAVMSYKLMRNALRRQQLLSSQHQEWLASPYKHEQRISYD
jgi:hypothetical protein